MGAMAELKGRKCPYCGKVLDHPYWRHIESDHPTEYQSDKATWIQLYKDYIAMGMDKEISIKVISELFNQTDKDILDFLKANKAY